MHADIVLPLHDPAGMVLHHLKDVTPILENRFGRVIACTTPQTRTQQPVITKWFENNPFYNLLDLEDSIDVGDQFKALYQYAVQQSKPTKVLHLAFPDRLVIALQSTEHREGYLGDLEEITENDLPILFQRSQKAWATHPATYRELEGIATRVGEMLFGRQLDFGWCYMVIRAGQLGETLSGITTTGLSVLAEILIPLREQVTTRSADWLAWEDPFITGEDPGVLAAQREESTTDHLKRLSYVIPTLQLLAQTADREGNRSAERN